MTYLVLCFGPLFVPFMMYEPKKKTDREREINEVSTRCYIYFRPGERYNCNEKKNIIAKNILFFSL